MTKVSITKLAVAALALSVAGVASAQSNGPSGFSGRLGSMWPKVGDNQIAFGVDYKFSSVAVPEARGAYRSYLGLAVDYYGRTDAWNIPIAATYNVRVGQLLLSAGGGLDIYKKDGGSKNGLGGQVGIAYEFATTNSETYNPLFIQAKYFFANEMDLSGFAAYVGYRF